MQRTLRIGMLGSNFIRIPPNPPEKYVPPGGSGAPELIVHYLSEELVKRGHAVTLFASGDSKTTAKLISVTPEATWKTKGIGPHEHYERVLISKAYQLAQAGNFDILHSHIEVESLHFAPLVTTPSVTTLHSPIDLPELHRDIFSYYKTTQYYVSISNNQRKALPDLHYIITAYNGIDISKMPFSAEREDYLIFAGRISEVKGVAEAIAVAKKTKQRLIIFGSADEKSDYWQKRIKPEIDDKEIVYKGIVSRPILFQALAHARAFIFPLQWEEPFGLALIEAMACGTPVIALRRGAVPEVIVDGKTGFIVDSLEEIASALTRVSSIDPAACRKHVEENFSIKQMVDRYEEAYYAILERQAKT